MSGHWLANAVFEEVPCLADTADSIPAGISGAAGDDGAGSHNVLTSLDADTFLIGVTVDLVCPTDWHSDGDTVVIVGSAVAIQANALHSVEDLIRATSLALLVDEVVSAVADAYAILVLTVGFTDGVRLAGLVDKSIVGIAKAAVSLEVEVAVGWTLQLLHALPVVHHQRGITLANTVL